MTPDQLKAIHDHIAGIVEGIINKQEEVQPQVFLVYGPGPVAPGVVMIAMPADLVMQGVSSPGGKKMMATLIGMLLRGDTKLPSGAPDAVVQVFEGWILRGSTEDAYDRERDGPIADMPNRGECAFIALNTLRGSTGGMVHIETDADGKRRAVTEPFSGEFTLTGRLLPDPPEMQ